MDKERSEKYILWLDAIGLSDLGKVGGKNASLGELYRELRPKGIAIPNGFAVGVNAYHEILERNNLKQSITEILAGLEQDTENLAPQAALLRQRILSAKMPPDLEEEILFAYRKLSHEYGEQATDVAVRSSATAEDLPDASFAGQQESYLNIRGEAGILSACQRCMASLFTARAISYRNRFQIDHGKVAISVGVQKMVRSDLANSGVMFTIDTETGFPEVVLINSALGLGENVVQGTVNPDEFYIFKPTLRTGFKPILRKRVGSKELKLVYDSSGEKLTRNVTTSPSERSSLSLSDEDALTLSRWAILIEDHYSTKRRQKTPMDIEWAKDGRSGDLFILQARPETVEARKERTTISTYQLEKKGTVLVTGHSVGQKIAQGKTRLIRNHSDRDLLQPGEVLVTDSTDPDWEPVMKLASAIVTNRGGRTCHAAIVSRELGIPAVVGALNATELLAKSREVTVSCAEGDVGRVYEGRLPFGISTYSLSEFQPPKTKMMLNIANPDTAFAHSFLPHEGVGLARQEFIINRYVKVHPLALLHFDQLPESAEKEELRRITQLHTSKPQYFIDRLAEGISMITAAFYPKDVIVRLSDFKTNEYAHLLGGKDFEPLEENPMLGFRGASRYYHPRYREAFALECAALRKVREEMGLVNLKIMLPFCRTPEEGKKVLHEMEKHGLVRGQQGLEVYMMCEIPSNVLLAEEFCEIFDGFSIGSNDLTQLVLGVDRESPLVADLFDERNPAVLKMIAEMIHSAKKQGKKIGICGQAPSDYPSFTEFLVSERIDSISLNPDAFLNTLGTILAAESRRPQETTPTEISGAKLPKGA